MRFINNIISKYDFRNYNNQNDNHKKLKINNSSPKFNGFHIECNVNEKFRKLSNRRRSKHKVPSITNYCSVVTSQLGRNTLIYSQIFQQNITTETLLVCTQN